MTFVIAECCVNWRDLDELHEMIRGAARAGAQAIKVQVYLPEHVKGHPREEDLKAIQIGPHEFEQIFEWCMKEGIELIGTPFYAEAVPWMNPFVRRWKVRYADRNNGRLTRTVAYTGKQILVSTQNPKDTYMRLNHGVYMFCVPEYPPLTFQMPQNFTKYRGFSSHYPSIIPPIIAAAKGALFVEVHVKLDSYSGDWVPIDEVVSVSMGDLKEMMRYVRAI
jgi:sialic acid synthase SpsE